MKGVPYSPKPQEIVTLENQIGLTSEMEEILKTEKIKQDGT